MTSGWQAANGAAIWISPGSDENEIVDNIFEDIQSDVIVLEGNRNRVETRRESDAVRDLGEGNRVGTTSGDSSKRSAAARSPAAVADSFVVAGGVLLHYLDFGGEGLPVVFVHSEAWDAHTYADFAPRFADRNRVLAVTGRATAHLTRTRTASASRPKRAR